jgi:hypothetical protein
MPGLYSAVALVPPIVNMHEKGWGLSRCASQKPFHPKSPGRAQLTLDSASGSTSRVTASRPSTGSSSSRTPNHASQTWVRPT